MFQLASGQVMPASGENIDFLSTFGAQADPQWGDDDHIQIVFFLIPKTYKRPIYLRIFDPECGGQHDLLTEVPWNTKTNFSVYGGAKAYSEKDAQQYNPGPNYRSGNLIISVDFSDKPYDNEWYTLGPFNPAEGEYNKALDGFIFKVIVEGTEGNDGNVYRLALSTVPKNNIPIPGGNAFTYNYTFRLKNSRTQVAHLYPYIDNSVISIKQFNFDFDSEGEIKLYSVAKNGHVLVSSGDKELSTSEHKVDEIERGKSMDIQIAKNQDRVNDMTFYILNQYNQAIPFFAIPIGGIPKYNFNIDIKYDYINKNKSY
ncbi:hypothetical protein [Luteibaculum oceani]|uniref:Uncharacterized protein n=1 Tax=Luteibaculum oceani TaxID=1294296 RepID=A0A5C6UWT0_9FLAO|nr:hypothetical protein [Luteibaculum oceani]TXC77040.1 hypothetical protein FRX97_09245 [Luteibaculum oceani]